MHDQFIEAMEDIFEVATQVYNVPNTPMTKEGMDTVAYSLDVIREHLINTVEYFCERLEYIKSLEIEKACGDDPTQKSMEIVREINNILGIGREE